MTVFVLVSLVIGALIVLASWVAAARMTTSAKFGDAALYQAAGRTRSSVDGNNVGQLARV